nr:unnamed protein product [Callosobruchus chinensis]
MEPKEGVALVKEGGFAYHSEVKTVYPLIAMTFDLDSICDMVEINFVTPGVDEHEKTAMAMEALHIVKQTGKVCTGSVIFLHGSGDTGQGFLNWVKFLMGPDFGLPHINFYFPTAPVRPYTPLQGNVSVP